MKTLDETIFEAPYTMTPWEENAIYYLKEYRDYMKNEIVKLQEEVKKQKEMIEFLEKPLTWDELKQMKGKPVWIEAESLSVGVSPYWKGWYIINSFSDDKFMYCNDEYEWAKEMQGRMWQAYRKER